MQPAAGRAPTSKSTRGPRCPAAARPAARTARTARTAKAPRAAAAADDLSPEAAKTFEDLRAWRAASAREQGVPAYVIFHDATLREIAMARPASLTELAEVSGVGETKLARYGEAILAVLG